MEVHLVIQYNIAGKLKIYLKIKKMGIIGFNLNVLLNHIECFVIFLKTKIIYTFQMKIIKILHLLQIFSNFVLKEGLIRLKFMKSLK